MAGFNKILLMGNLTRDPQLSYTPNQTAVVDFGLAVNRKWTGKDGEQKEETCFVDCRAFGRQAENINKYLTKGRLVFVEGRLTFDSWTSQDGTKRSKHRVTVETFQFLPGTGGASSGTDETPATRLPASTHRGEPDEQGSVESQIDQRTSPDSGGETSEDAISPAKDDIPF